MRFMSRDRTMILSIITPALGLTVSFDEHVWLFNSRLQITGSLPPPTGHSNARTPEACPAAWTFRFAITAVRSRYEKQTFCVLAPDAERTEVFQGLAGNAYPQSERMAGP